MALKRENVKKPRGPSQAVQIGAKQLAGRRAQPRAVSEMKRPTSPQGNMPEMRQTMTASARPRSIIQQPKTQTLQQQRVMGGKRPLPQRGARRFADGGAVYEVNGQRVTKEQYEEASKKMDKPRSKAEEELFDFADKAKARNKMTPINKAKGGEAKKKPPGLYANIHAKRKRIAAGSNEKMRKVGSKGAPTKAAFIKSAKTAKKGK